jgi:SAM-dependent methyltransferase
MNGDIVNGELGKSYYSNRREILRKRVERIGDFVEKGMTIFEIGCGGGYLLEYYKKKGHSVAGVEIDDLCVNACRHLGIDCVDGDFLEMEVRKRWGAVMAWHALEHSDDINEFMRKVVEMTNGGSLVFIEVPTGRGPVENWELYDGHVHYFSRKSLKRLTDKFGLSCLHLGEGIQKPAMLYIGKVDETIF